MNQPSANLALQEAATAVDRNSPGHRAEKIIGMLRNDGNSERAQHELKHDPVLLYQFMTYLRSVGVGYQHDAGPWHPPVLRGQPEQFKNWVSQFADSGCQEVSRSIGKNAVVRGRFLELIGKTMFGDKAADELFIVGIFSVLDILLAQPMRKLLDGLTISEEMHQALLYRKGAYAPLLFLAKAIEDANEQRIDQLQATLQIPIEVMYETYNAALEWAEQR